MLKNTNNYKKEAIEIVISRLTSVGLPAEKIREIIEETNAGGFIKVFHNEHARI